MARIFLSHASGDGFPAAALRDWLAREGWDDVFLDFDPDRGIAAGERWERALYAAADRCEAVIVLLSGSWLASGWCRKEYELAKALNKKLLAVVIDRGLTLAGLPKEFTGTWQVVDLVRGQEFEAFTARPAGREDEGEVAFAADGLRRLKRGLEKAGLDPRFFAWPPADDPDRSPYPGLRPLEERDAGILFGRDAPIVEAIDRLRGLAAGAAPRFFVVLGASGAGKSSFLRAGLLPRLAREDVTFLPLPPVRPERAAMTGDDGFVTALAHAIPERDRAKAAAAVAGGAAKVRALLAEFVAEAARKQVREDAGTRPPAVVIAVDQAEELLTGEGAEQGERLLALLRELADGDDPAVIVIFAIRSDAYDALERARPLQGCRQAAMPLLPMPRAAYKEIIEGPARRFHEAGGRFGLEPQLVSAVLDDMERGAGSDALPLLAFTLEQLFGLRGGAGTVRLDDYRAFGGLRGAIRAAVDRALRRAGDDPRIPADRAGRDALLRRALVPWLAGVDPQTRAPRRALARRDELPADALPLIDLLIDERLLSTDTDTIVDGESGRTRRVVTVEPSHEALLRQWDLLAGWLADDFSLLAALDGVQRAARDWAANGEAQAWLAHGGERLADAEALGSRPDLDAKLGSAERAYLAACRARDRAAAAEIESRRQEREAETARRLADAQALAAADRRTAQRTRIGLAAAIVLAVLAGGFGIYAQLQRGAAQLALTTATNTSNALVVDIAREFKNVAGVPASLVRTVLDRALGLQGELIRAGNMGPALMRARASALNAASDTLVTVGDASASRKAATEAADIWRRQVAAAPGDPAPELGLVGALDNLGYAAQLAADTPVVLASYGEGLDIVRRLAATNGSDPIRYRLATALQRMGDAHSAAGDNRAGLRDYEEALPIYRDLVGHGPSSATDSDVAHTLDRIGAVKSVLGERAGALAALTESLDLRRRFALAHPDDTMAARDLAWTLGQLAEFHEAGGDRQAALTAYEESLAIRRRLAADRSNARAQRDLSVSLSKIAGLRSQLGDTAGALKALEEGLVIARRFAQDEGNAEAQRNLAETLQSEGDIRAAADDGAGAARAYGNALAIFRKLAAGGDSSARRDLALILDSLGDVQSETLGDKEGASASYAEGLAIRRERAAAATADAEAQRDLGIGLSKVANLSLARGDRTGAMALLEESLAIFRRLASGSGRQDASARRDLTVALNDLGTARASGGDMRGALALFEEALGIVRAIARDAPVSTTDRDLAAELDRVAHAKADLGDEAGAREAWAECLPILRRLDGGKPDARSRNELARVAEKLGRLRLAAADYAGAAEAFGIAAEPLRAMLAGGDVAARERLVVALNTLGGMRLQVHDDRGALAAFAEAVETARPLAGTADGRRNLASLLDNVGETSRKLHDLDGAARAYGEALPIRRASAGPAGSAPQLRLDLAVNLEHLSDVQLDRRELDPALAGYREAVVLRRAILAEVPSARNLKLGIEDDGERVGAIAFELLPARAFERSLSLSDEAIALAPGRLWMQANRAHALMFLGRTGEARAIYMGHRGERAQSDQTWEQAVLGDFAAFRKAGLVSPMMSEIEEALAKTG